MIVSVPYHIVRQKSALLHVEKKGDRLIVTYGYREASHAYISEHHRCDRDKYVLTL